MKTLLVDNAHAKRALEVALAGGHTVRLEGTGAKGVALWAEVTHGVKVEAAGSADITVTLTPPSADAVMDWIDAGFDDPALEKRLERAQRIRADVRPLPLDGGARALLRSVVEQLSPSPLQVFAICQVAYTIAALAEAARVNAAHIAEAVALTGCANQQ